MKKVGIVITVITLYAALFQVAPYIGLADEIIFLMFFFSPILVLYMTYVILRYGKPSAHTFDERFYDDMEGSNR